MGYPLPGFDRLVVADGLCVRILAGESPHIALEADEQTLLALRFGSEGATLFVDRAGRAAAAPGESAQLTFRVPVLRALRLESGSAATVEGVQIADELDLEVFGGSRLRFDSRTSAPCERIGVSNSGSFVSLECHARQLCVDALDGAQTICSGGARQAELHCAAGSRLDAGSCVVDDVELRLSASSATVFASRWAKGVASQGSELFLRGSAHRDVEARQGSQIRVLDPSENSEIHSVDWLAAATVA